MPMLTPTDTFVYGRDLEVCRWVEAQIGAHFYGYVALGMERDGEMIAGIVLDRFGKRECQMHIAGKPGKLWATPEAIRRAFEFPFLRCQRERVTVETPVTNTRARRYNEHIGFVREGLKRGAGDDGCDMIIYGMLRSECRWLD
jgi:RimJ/RimL family protein N-acetyltransferase